MRPSTTCILLLAFTACGMPPDPAWPVTKCGLHVDVPVGYAPKPGGPRYLLTFESAQLIEDWTVEEFQKSSDPRLHHVCEAAKGFTVHLRSEIINPADGTPAAGISYCWLGDVSVTTFWMLAHELAHVAQDCDGDSYEHKNWPTQVQPHLDAIWARILTR